MRTFPASADVSPTFDSNDIGFDPTGAVVIGFDHDGDIEIDESVHSPELGGVRASFLGLNGVASWVTTMEGGSFNLHIASLTVLPNRSVVAVGTFQRNAWFGRGREKVESNVHGRDSFAVRVFANGGIHWAVAIGRTPADGDSVRSNITRAVTNAPGQGVFVAGHYEGDLELASQWFVSEEVDAYVAKIDRTGQVQWAAPIWGAGSQEAVAIASMNEAPASNAAGSAVYVGVKNHNGSCVGFREGSASGETVVVRFSDDSGAPDWGIGFDARIGALACTADGDVLVAGTFRSSVDFGGLLLTSPSTFDTGFIVKYSSAGRPLWARMIPGRGSVRCREVEVTPLGEVVVAGTFDTAATFGAVEKVGFGGQDVFILRLGPDGGW